MEFTDRYRVNCYYACIKSLVKQIATLYSDPTIHKKVKNGILFGNDQSIPENSQIMQRGNYKLAWHQNPEQLYLETPLLTATLQSFLSSGGEFSAYSIDVALFMYEVCRTYPDTTGLLKRFVITPKDNNILVQLSLL